MEAQIQAFIRSAALAGGGVLATKFGLDGNFAPMLASIAVALAGYGWSVFTHTNNQVIAAASAIPSVQAVVVPKSAASTTFANNSKVVGPTDPLPLPTIVP